MSNDNNGKGFTHVGPLKPIHVPVEKMDEHALLKKARLVNGKLVWHGLDLKQLRSVASIKLVEQGTLVSIPPRVNLDYFVEDDTRDNAPPFWRGRADDLLRFYMRFSDTGWYLVGTYAARTIDGVRRYFEWRSGEWLPISVAEFVRCRDSDNVIFSEVRRSDVDEQHPGAVGIEPPVSG